MGKKTIIISLILFSVSFAMSLYAQSDVITIGNPVGSDDLGALLNKIWTFIFYFAIGVVPIMAIVVGFMFMTSGGESTKLNKAKEFLLWLVIGVVVILLAGGIVGVIKKILGVE